MGRVEDSVGRFPGRVFSLSSSLAPPSHTEAATAAGPAWRGEGGGGGTGGWRWVRREGGEAAAGAEEADDEAAAGAEEVVWLGLRAGIFLPWTVRLG